jgi:hypothetical protein
MASVCSCTIPNHKLHASLRQPSTRDPDDDDEEEEVEEDEDDALYGALQASSNALSTVHELLPLEPPGTCASSTSSDNSTALLHTSSILLDFYNL